MTHLDRLDEWVVEHEAELKELGTVTYTHDSSDSSAAHLVVAREDIDVELLLWVSGEAEFNYGSAEAPVFEHVEVESPEELSALLARVLAVARAGST